MKKILFLFALILICFAGFSQTGNDTTKYTWYKYTYGNRLQRYWADSVLDIPHDTTHSKYGLARKHDSVFVGNGVRWRMIGDTASSYVTPVGVGSPQIQTLWASADGNLRTARFVPGVFTTPVQNGDSAVHIDLDTTGVGGAAYKAWIIAQYGPPVGGNLYTIDGKLMTDRHVSGSDTHSLSLDSLKEFFLNDSAGHSIIDIDPLGEFATIGTFNSSGTATSQMVFGSDLLGFTALNGWSVGGGIGGLPAFTLKEQASSISSWNLYWPKNNAGGTDTLATLSDVRAGSGGGGSSTATIQTITSGSSGTVTGSNYWVRFNPAAALATYTLTLPASPTVGQSVTVIFGGTITAGIVVTAFTVAPNTSQSIIDNTPPAGSSVTADNAFEYLYVATNLWIRKKL